MSTAAPFHGEVACARAGCPNRAYYALAGTYWCGVHSKRDAAARRPLPKDPGAGAKRQRLFAEHKEAALVVPAGVPVPGRVTCYRMLMMRQVPLEGRWLNVMPNRKAVTRTDGVGMPSLSPMLLGPVPHRQPGLPAARNIENYHQANKVWSSELATAALLPLSSLADDINVLPPPSAAWYARRLELYEDEEPHRHKFADTKKDETGDTNPNPNAPLYSVHLALDGTERRFTYVASRYFYCCAYEHLATQQPAFRQLADWHRAGVDLRLCGYDAFDMGESADADTLYAHYCDAARPFGHERVLYVLLMLAHTPDALPWHRYRRDHPTLYDNVAHVTA